MCLLRKKRTSVRVHPKHRPDRIGSSRGYLATSPPRPLPGVRHACTRRAVSCPPMLRRLFTLLSALSLLLCVAVGGVWGRSYWASDYIGREDGAGWVGVLSMS